MIMITSITLFIIFFTLIERSMKEEAESRAAQNAYSKIVEIEREINKLNGSNDEYITYYMKEKCDDYMICYKSDDDGSFKVELYNHTVFSYSDLEKLNYEKAISDGTGQAELEKARINYENSEYVVFQKTVNSSHIYKLYGIEDIAYVEERLGGLIYRFAITVIVVIMITGVVLTFLLNRQFIPLQRLKEKTNEISTGDYSARVSVSTNSKNEIVELGNHFNEMAEAVEKRDRNLKLFMGNLTHELKTPMTAISGYAQTLLNVKLEKEEEEEALIYIYQECQRLERLSKKMMKLLETENSDKLPVEKVNVAELFEKVRISCSGILDNKQVTLYVEEQGEQFLIEQDLMIDVLINLVDNAVKASKKGGTVILRSNKNRIEVQDFGCGIPKDEQDKILEPFYMMDKSRSRKNGGAGLGLALVAIIIRKHGARLDIESEVGKGTKMILQFV